MKSFIENVGMKKIIIICVLLFVSLVIMFLLINKTSSYEKKLVECSANVSLDQNTDVSQKITVYESSNGKKIVVNVTFDLNNNRNFSKKQLDSIKNLISSQMESRLKNVFGDNYKYVSDNLDVSNDNITYKVELTINEENQSDMYTYFQYDYLTSTSDDIVKYLETGGLKCEKY